jgi:hypothetical protein
MIRKKNKMKIVNFPSRDARDKAFDNYAAKGIRADAYVVKNGDMHYEESVAGRYLVRRDRFFLEVFEEEQKK